MTRDPNKYNALLDSLLQFRHENGPKWEVASLGEGFSLKIPNAGFFFLMKWERSENKPESIVLAIFGDQGETKANFRSEKGDEIFAKMDQLYTKAGGQAHKPVKASLDSLTSLITDFIPG